MILTIMTAMFLFILLIAKKINAKFFLMSMIVVSMIQFWNYVEILMLFLTDLLSKIPISKTIMFFASIGFSLLISIGKEGVKFVRFFTLFFIISIIFYCNQIDNYLVKMIGFKLTIILIALICLTYIYLMLSKPRRK